MTNKLNPKNQTKMLLHVDKNLHRVFFDYCLRYKLDPDEAIELAITQFMAATHFTASECKEYDKLINDVLKRITTLSQRCSVH